MNKNDKGHDSQDMISFRITDQCFTHDKIKIKPIYSAEKSDCVILRETECGDYYGKVFSHHEPICFPKFVDRVKIDSDSFVIETVKISNITSSTLRKGYWDVEIQFICRFELNIYDSEMNKLKIICLDEALKTSSDFPAIKETLKGYIVFVQNISLFGGIHEWLNVSDLFKTTEETPHVTIDCKIYPLAVDLEKCIGTNLDETYEDHCFYGELCILFCFIAYMFRFDYVNICCKQMEQPSPCKDINKDCSDFEDIKFPMKDFNPPSERPEL